jgi:hypothetical protein
LADQIDKVIDKLDIIGERKKWPDKKLF